MAGCCAGLRRATVLSRVFRYNVVEHNERKTVEWEAVANMPTARSGLACAAIDTLVYCAHGRLSNRANDYTNKLEVRGDVDMHACSAPCVRL
jgi:hypothetical protein